MRNVKKRRLKNGDLKYSLKLYVMIAYLLLYKRFYINKVKVL